MARTTDGRTMTLEIIVVQNGRDVRMTVRPGHNKAGTRTAYLQVTAVRAVMPRELTFIELVEMAGRMAAYTIQRRGSRVHVPRATMWTESDGPAQRPAPPGRGATGGDAADTLPDQAKLPKPDDRYSLTQKGVKALSGPTRPLYGGADAVWPSDELPGLTELLQSYRGGPATGKILRGGAQRPRSGSGTSAPARVKRSGASRPGPTPEGVGESSHAEQGGLQCDPG